MNQQQSDRVTQIDPLDRIDKSIEIDAPADGFLALPGWRKGFLWLNGTLLGRYWGIGPQVTLYAPAPLWRSGSNDIVILEMEQAGGEVELRAEPDLG